MRVDLHSTFRQHFEALYAARSRAKALIVADGPCNIEEFYVPQIVVYGLPGEIGRLYEADMMPFSGKGLDELMVAREILRERSRAFDVGFDSLFAN